MHPDGDRPRGFLLTLEGPEGSGKSTQAQRLASRLTARGRGCVVTREPGGTVLGEEIRHILLHARELTPVPAADALLFNAARAQLVAEVIRPGPGARRRGDLRSLRDSTLAYQGYGAGQPLDALRGLASVRGGGSPAGPDGPDRPARGRGPASQEPPDEMTRFEEREDLAFHRRVRQGFLELAAAEPDRFVVIDGRQSVGAIEAAISEALGPRLSRRAGVDRGQRGERPFRGRRGAHE